MKQVAIWTAALAMTVLLTACGGRNTTDYNYGNTDGYNSAYNADGYNSGYNNDVTDNYANGSMAGGSTYGNGVYGNTYGNNTTNYNTKNSGSADFQQMLENARVHDTDGVLTDGENSRTR